MEKKSLRVSFRTILQATPLLIFWVKENKTIFSGFNQKGVLRGRSLLIGKEVYIIIYTGSKHITSMQLYFLRISYPNILRKLEQKHPKLISQIQDALFVTESGDLLEI